MAKTKKQKISDAVRASLIEQLVNHNADIELFKRRIDDYIFFYEQLQEMQEDIKTRGRVYEAMSSQGKVYDKDNPSVVNALRYSQEMTKILTSLGLTVSTVIKEVVKDEDADDL